jgi:ligand-binding sensor domain-containing protein/serine phosphatase RsbU (regulator of sigma subunit)
MSSIHAVVGLSLLAVLMNPVSADEPSLTRLSFWVDPARMGEFEAEYQARVVPHLDRLGFVASSRVGRVTVDSVFSRLFECDTPLACVETYQRLNADSLMATVRRDLAPFGATGADSVRSRVMPYDMAAGPGHSVRTGGGARRGSWHTYTMADGLPSQSIDFLLQDHGGDLWGVGHYFGRLFRFDGAGYTIFTAEDGLSGRPSAFFQDADGVFWIACWDSGLARFDGDRFTTYTTEDGLAGEIVLAILQSQDGRLWVGTDGGVSIMESGQITPFVAAGTTQVQAMFEDSRRRLWIGTQAGGLLQLDGDRLTTFTTSDGLAGGAFADGSPRYEISGIAETGDGDLWFGSCCGLSRYDGDRFTTYGVRDGLVAVPVNDVEVDGDGGVWVATDGGVSRYDGTGFENYTGADGLAQNAASDAFTDRDGNVWIGTGGGLSRFTGHQFLSVTAEQAQMGGGVMAIGQDVSGMMWFGSWEGVGRFDGARFTTTDSLAAMGYIRDFFQDSRGRLWLAGPRGDPVRYVEDGELHTFLAPDGHAIRGVVQIAEDADGVIWFAGNANKPPGLRSYDGEQVRSWSVADGLISNRVCCVVVDGGDIWVGSGGGLSRYNGQSFTNYTVDDGLVNDAIWTLTLDRRGNLWVGTRFGISRYDGNTFHSYTRADGLRGDFGSAILEDRRGTMWFGHWDGGVTRYDGAVFQSITMADGLVHDAVQELFEDDAGDIWIATEGGITRYRPAHTTPAVEVVNVTGDREYGGVSVVHLANTQDYLAFQVLGSSLNAPADRMVYAYRLVGLDSAWQWSADPRITYADVPLGDYDFEVKAVDRDLNYSEPATVQVVVSPAYAQLLLLFVGVVSLLGLVAVGRAARQRRRERDQARDQLLREHEEELQTARQMQMRLMPTVAPALPGLDVAGTCRAANHVGGDLFQYFDTDTSVCLVLADVTGHGMAAAIPVVMFSGILDREMERPSNLAMRFAGLNRSLHRSLDAGKYICFTMAEIDRATKTLHLASCGNPYPLHFHDGELTEVQRDGYPLGVRADTEYAAVEAPLHEGDYLVLYSDGIPEITNGSEEMFGYDRVLATVHEACRDGLSAQDVVARLLARAREFAGDEPPTDDMTCVALRVTDRQAGP